MLEVLIFFWSVVCEGLAYRDEDVLDLSEKHLLSEGSPSLVVVLQSPQEEQGKNSKPWPSGLIFCCCCFFRSWVIFNFWTVFAGHRFIIKICLNKYVPDYNGKLEVLAIRYSLEPLPWYVLRCQQFHSSLPLHCLWKCQHSEKHN